MDQHLKAAAEAGNVSRLYELIEANGNIFKRFDKVEFVETPLHIAVEKGCGGFAMEIVSLKSSFVRKLNHRGLSPMYLAVEKGQQEIALRLLEVDKDLVRVRGKNVQNRTAFHVAIENNRPDVLQVLLRSLGKNDYYQEVVNKKDEDSNTVLHIAASNNQPQQILKLLLECKVDKYTTNQAGLTALDVAHQSNNRESITILHRDFIPAVSNFKYKLEKHMVKYVTKASLLIFHDMDNISGDDRNTLLAILGLLLTASYQVTLSPPGGVWQGDGSSTSTPFRRPGSSIMDPFLFLLYFIPTYSVFIVAFFPTLV
ncbi:hypothetical protein V6N11_084438 [Hibiscus sabdariffa]|uniref:PGG domain-containing protein n=1 Tax=Hibiscus sabdariffa TaxID=183260 RepID=A0ABR2NCH1_9ROSI